MWFEQLTTILSAFSLTAPASEIVDDGVKQVAIIGAGAGGSATAYFLRQYADAWNLDLNITVFEKTERIGGRTMTVNVYDDPEQPIELGASIFADVNHILVNAVETFQLPLKDPESDSEEVLGIWDGDEFVYTQTGDLGYWNLAKLFWKYGTSPYKAYQLMKSTVASFLKLYEDDHFPFRSLTQAVTELGLLHITEITGAKYLATNGISELFASHLIQAATRVNYASNLMDIHGLETMVSIAAQEAYQVVGGNWQIFDKMVERSNATVHLSTAIESIAFKNGTGPGAGADAKYLLSTGKTESSDGEQTDVYHPVAFDKVVVATPWQFANIDAKSEVLKQEIDEIPYTKLHVTLLSSPFLLSPEYFNLPAGSKTPDAILTTLSRDEASDAEAPGVGKAGFFSLTTQRKVINPKTLGEEYVYKIFSAEEVTAEFLSKVFGVKVPEAFVVEDGAEAVDEEGATVNPISWFHPAVFYSYPVESPRTTFQDPEIGEGLYYTSGIESFISTMETSALMGKNIAALIADDFKPEVVEEITEEQQEQDETKAEENLVEVNPDPAQDTLKEEVAPDEL